MTEPRACFVSASEQNAFFGELTEALRAGLEEAGVATETAEDHFPPLADDRVYVVVPHEYVRLTQPSAQPIEAQLRRTVVIATEQPGTSWFDESLQFSRRAAVTLDLNPLGVSALKRSGVDARRLPLGYVPQWDRWNGTDSQRPIDATFLGGHTPRRARVLARCGRVLQDRRASIHMVEGWRPYPAGDAHFLQGARKHRHLAASKILLNTHRGSTAYFEWVRFLEAAVNGCAVLTEHSTGFGPLVPGEHFASVAYENLPVALSTLLDDGERREALRRKAYDFLREELPLSTTTAVVAGAVADAARRPVGSRPPHNPRPAPKRPPRPPALSSQALVEPDELTRVRIGLKRLVLGQQRLERRLARLADPDDRIDFRHFGPRPAEAPKVTVVITLYNYADTVEEALRSVALAAGEGAEVVLVDDASTDGSLVAAEDALGRFPWLPATVISRSHNAGLPAARNLAVEHARGKYLFVLDADNAIYPYALERLASALDEHPDAAFAYGICERFDGGGPLDLESWLPWQPDRLRLGNYIDALAMIRRSVLREVGGFTTDDRLYGWEDFALWCAFAQRGLEGIFVPEIVARYRRSVSSMLTATNIDATEASARLVDLYPFLLEEPATDETLG
jgi:GT2 family glycosyltransferase